MVSPQFARQEIRALCRSMTDEVDARAAAAHLASDLRDRARWGAEEDTELGELVEEHRPKSSVSVACPLCRAPSKVVLPEEMHTSLSLGPTKRRRRPDE